MAAGVAARGSIAPCIMTEGKRGSLIKMFKKFISAVFGSRNARMLKRQQELIGRINALEPRFKATEDLATIMPQLRTRHDNGETLDALLPETFAAVREAARRTLEMRHFDVQLHGGVVLHRGMIAEMRTGEGKTLVATLAASLNALTGRGVHLVTVNDYLAARDAEWMGAIYNALGFTVGTIVSNMRPAERREAYAADITYGTNNEFGFDFLRDNMVRSMGERVQHGLHCAIVDEVDLVLIDEARTPLIISGSTDRDTERYSELIRMVPKLKPEDYTLEEKSRQVHLTEDGHARVEQLLDNAGLLVGGQSLYATANIELLHYLDACLRAQLLYKCDVDYIVKDGGIVIVDQFTGRTMPGRRWSEGLHQAIEAKEGVTVQEEYHTLAGITYQNYFRMYDKLAGMTGTADTEAQEFQQIYGLEVVVVPTHKKMIREDHGDVVFLTATEKFEAIVEDILECRAKERPVLVGTTSIEVSELISGMLKKQRVPHQVLNAKQHAREAEIIAQAGRPGAVTIATNMAGRGTDIILGGNPEADSPDAKTPVEWEQRYQGVVAAGGLHIVGTERHESRRIDNQLRGRSGRQGDPGSSRFYLSLEDNLMRIFASDRVSAIMQKFGMQEGEAIEHPWVTKAIENAQQKVEAHNFDIRKNLLEYDDIANEQRKVIYEQRNEILEQEDITTIIKGMRQDVVDTMVSERVPPESMYENWDLDGLNSVLEREFKLSIDLGTLVGEESSTAELVTRVQEHLEKVLQERLEGVAPDILRGIEKQVLLDVIDRRWREHLQALEHLRRGINLRAYAARNPKREFKSEAFSMFMEMLEVVKRDVTVFLVRMYMHVRELKVIPAEHHPTPVAARAMHDAPADLLHPPMPPPTAPQPVASRPAAAPAPSSATGPAPAAAPIAAPPLEKPATFVRSGRKIGRNEPCPCGSGKKYKRCHGTPSAHVSG